VTKHDTWFAIVTDLIQILHDKSAKNKMPLIAFNMIPIQGQGRAAFIVVSLFFVLMLISSLLEDPGDEYYASPNDSASLSQHQQQLNRIITNPTIRALYEANRNETIHFAHDVREDSFSEVNLHRTNDLNKYNVFVQMSNKDQIYITAVYPYGNEIFIQQYSSPMKNSDNSTKWTLIHEEHINGQLVFVQESTDNQCSKCVHYFII
jgi:hypothetical protein